MTFVMCSIFDKAAEAWTMPMFFQAPGQAMRSFADAINGDGDLSSHPEDYTLFIIGSFNQRSGKLEVREAPEPLAVGVNMLRSVEEVN